MSDNSYDFTKNEIGGQPPGLQYIKPPTIHTGSFQCRVCHGKKIVDGKFCSRCNGSGKETLLPATPR